VKVYWQRARWAFEKVLQQIEHYCREMDELYVKMAVRGVRRFEAGGGAEVVLPQPQRGGEHGADAHGEPDQ
jgi:hypothetical protein